MRSADPSVRIAALSIVCLVFGAGISLPAAEFENRYNVLFIAIDDLRPELGCYGAESAQTPHLDEFSKRAFLFDRHYVQVPTCGASRYALLTGRSPKRSKVTQSNTALYSGSTALNAEQQTGAQSLPELFRRSGYRTIGIGKISHTPDGRVYEYNGQGDGRAELPHAWDELKTPLGSWKRGWGAFFAYADGKHREDGAGHNALMEFTAKNDEDLPDGLMAKSAIESLRSLQSSRQPFFLGLGFFKPHLPFVATKQDWDAFEDIAIPLPSAGKIESPYWHKSGEFSRYAAPFKKSRPLSPEASRTSKRAYYACVRYVDRQVGRVLSELAASGLEKNTIVIVWGDHGWHLGEQDIWGKHSPFERANKSVLMIRVPGMTDRGMKTSALVESLDLYPTLIELCRPTFQKTHWPLDGRSLVPLLEGKTEAVRDAAVSYWGNTISVRSAMHRLIVGKQNGEPYTALYDLSENPDHSDNLAETRPDLVRKLRQHIPPAKNR